MADKNNKVEVRVRCKQILVITVCPICGFQCEDSQTGGISTMCEHYLEYDWATEEAIFTREVR